MASDSASNLMHRRGLLATLASLPLAGVALTSRAQEWPPRQVRIVAPFPAAGTADTLARALALQLAETTRQNFVVENRAGAGGAIGSDLVAKSAPDGATLVISGIASHVVAPVTAKVAYHPLESFSHIALLGGPPAVLAVNAQAPVKNVRDFITFANALSGGASWGSSGTGTHAHLIGELFREATGARLVHISYKGGAPVMTDLIGNQIPASFTALSSAMPHLRTGRVRALAVTSRNRNPELPDVPTFAEAGFPRLTATTWFSISGPAGMPAAMVAQINTEVRRAMIAPRVRERLAAEGIEAADLDPAAFTQFIKSEIERWTPIARAVQPQS